MKTSIWWHPFYIIIIAILLFGLFGNWFGLSINSDEITIETPEKKGTIQTSVPLMHTPILRPGLITPKTVGSVSKNRQNTALSVHADHDTENYYLNQRLLAETADKIEAYKKLDSLEQLRFVERILQPMDVVETLEDSIIKIDFSGKVVGELKNVKLDYTIKPFKFKTNLKQYYLLGGVNLTSNTQLNKMGVMPTVSYFSPNKTLISIGKDILCEDCYIIGVQKKIFGFSKQIKK